MKIEGEFTVLHPEDEEQIIEFATNQAIKSGIPLRIGYKDGNSLRPSGIYNPRLVSFVKEAVSRDEIVSIPVIPNEKMLDFAAQNTMHFFTVTGSGLDKAIKALDLFPDTKNIYTYRGMLRANKLEDLIAKIDEQSLPQQVDRIQRYPFEPSYINFLQDCSANLLDRAVKVELNPMA